MNVLTVLQHKPMIQDFWCQWCNSYGREGFIDRDRVFLSSSRTFLDYVEDCECEHTACWMSAQPFKKRNEVVAIEKLFFDFDCEKDLRKAWTEARDFAVMLKAFYKAESLLCFSGFKGYHVYVWLTEPIEFSGEQQASAKRFYSAAQNMLVKGLKFESLDRQVIGDIKRLARVPYTVHEKSGNPCIPVTLKHQPLLVLSLEGYRKHGLSPIFAGLCFKEAKKARRRRASRFKTNMGKVRPCFEAALENTLRSVNGHGMRLAIAVEYLHTGCKPEDIAVLFENQPDYSFEKSLFFIEDALKRGYKPYKCKTIQSYGFCLHENCAYFKKRETGEQ